MSFPPKSSATHLILLTDGNTRVLCFYSSSQLVDTNPVQQKLGTEHFWLSNNCIWASDGFSSSFAEGLLKINWRMTRINQDPFKQRITCYKMVELASTTTWAAPDKSLLLTTTHWAFLEKRDLDNQAKERKMFHQWVLFVGSLFCKYKLSWGADETIVRENESLHHPEAAGWRHLWQRADGEKQRVWRAGGH